MIAFTRCRAVLMLVSACILACTSFATRAEQAYGTVLEATPIYEEVTIPQEECTEYAQQKRCEIRTIYEEKLIGYDVLYEYEGQQFAQRMTRKPSKHIPVQTAAPHPRYNSRDRANGTVATPGTKSYGSITPGAADVESIQYQNDAPEPLLNLDLRLGRPPYSNW